MCDRSPIEPSLLILVALATFMAASSGAQPIALSDLTGKTGAFQIKLTDRSPLSARDEFLKRVRAKPQELGDDYDLSQQTFDVYVPAEAGEGGKYGLMVGVVFADGHGFAPQNWRPVLEKYHIIWIAPGHGGDDRPAFERMGEALDATFDACKLWSIDKDRIYLAMNTWKRPVTGLGLYYSEVYTGVLASCFALSWVADLQNSKGRWPTSDMPHPLDASWGMAKSRPIFFVVREGEKRDRDDLILKSGYQASGFNFVKLVEVKPDDMHVWSDYPGSWFEQGIEYLDASRAQSKPQLAATAPATAPAKAPASDDPKAKAARALSLAKTYISAGKYDLARSKLQKIVETYPETPAAKEAKTILMQIQGK